MAKNYFKENPFAWILILLTIELIGSGIGTDSAIVRIITLGVFFALTILCVYFAKGNGFPFKFVSVLSALCFIAGIFLDRIYFDSWIYIFIVLAIPTMGSASYYVLTYIFKKGRVSANKIYAAVCIYLLLGLMFGFTYFGIDMKFPGSFHSADHILEHTDQLPYIYFSFTTLTTLGFGDITPVGSLSQNLTSIEAIMGQLFLTVLIARLVGLHIVESNH